VDRTRGDVVGDQGEIAVAQRLDEFPDAPVQSNYPWDEWFDGSVWQLTPGEDFKGKPATFRASAVAQAARRDGKVRTRKIIGPDGEERLYLQFYRD
jgi:hypothetical protein